MRDDILWEHLANFINFRFSAQLLHCSHNAKYDWLHVLLGDLSTRGDVLSITDKDNIMAFKLQEFLSQIFILKYKF